MTQAAEQSGLFGGSGVGTVLLIIGMVLALAIVSGLGILARLRDRSVERKAAGRVAPTGPEPSDGGPD